MTATSPDPKAVDRFLRRRRIRRRVLGIVLLLLAASVVVGNVWQQRAGGGDRARFDRHTFTIEQIVSGDTVTIRDAAGITTVRLIGIDAPDLPPETTKPAHWSAEARQALADHVAGRGVMLRLPPLAARTPDGTLLAYLHADGSAQSVNLQLIADGHAFADRRSPHPMHKQFEQAEGEARRKKKALWKDGRDEDQPAWRQEWLKEQRRDRERRDGTNEES